MPLSSRQKHDIFAIIVHIIFAIVTIALWSATPHPVASPRKPISLAFFLVQEIVAIGFHAYYLTQYRKFKSSDWWNKYKWQEYALSATAGTVGTFFAAIEPHTFESVRIPELIVLFALGFGQQLIGRYIDDPDNLPSERAMSETLLVAPADRAAPIKAVSAKIWILFAVAFVCQAIEYTIIIYREPPAFIMVTYVFMWTLFGVHAGLRLYALHSQATADASPAFLKPWTSQEWTELIYSFFGWIAKISVALMAVPDAFVDIHTGGQKAAMYISMTFLIFLTMLEFRRLYKGYSLK